MVRVKGFFAPLVMALMMSMAMPAGAETAAEQQLADAQQVAATQDENAQYAPRGEDSCLRCHDEPPATLVLDGPHALKADERTPFANHQCESCHGASPEHLRKEEGQEQRDPPAITFGAGSATPVATQNQVCLDCHKGGERMNWHGSQHQMADVPCASCHDIHAHRDTVQAKATQSEVCFNCHKQQRADSFKRSHHPTREGEVACSDCHNPHGSPTPTLLRGLTVNDTCYDCHAEKRGPFLWNHAPVREDCTICHTPHGSTQPRLLKARVPFLCQECHMAQYHPSTAYDGASLAGNAHQLIAKGCLNCHSQVHGSNHPSGVRNMR